MKEIHPVCRECTKKCKKEPEDWCWSFPPQWHCEEFMYREGDTDEKIIERIFH